MTRWRHLLERIAIGVAAVLLGLALIYLAQLVARAGTYGPDRARAEIPQNF